MKIFVIYSPELYLEQFIYLFFFFDGKFSWLREILKFFKFLQQDDRVIETWIFYNLIFPLILCVTKLYLQNETFVDRF